MAQETTSLNTQNRNGGFFGNLFGTIGQIVTTTAPLAADVYKLKLQGEQLQQQYAAEALRNGAAAAQPANLTGATQSGFSWQPWMTWASVAVAALLGFLLLRRR